MAVPTYVGSSERSTTTDLGSGNFNHVFTVENAIEGDVLVLHLSIWTHTGQTIVAPPAGWDPLELVTADDWQTWMWVKLATADDESGSATYTVEEHSDPLGSASSVMTIGVIHVLRNVDPAPFAGEVAVASLRASNDHIYDGPYNLLASFGASTRTGTDARIVYFIATATGGAGGNDVTYPDDVNPENYVGDENTSVQVYSAVWSAGLAEPTRTFIGTTNRAAYNLIGVAFGYTESPTAGPVVAPDETTTHLVLPLHELNEGYWPGQLVGIAFAGITWTDLAALRADHAVPITEMPIIKQKHLKTDSYFGYEFTPWTTTPAGHAYGWANHNTYSTIPPDDSLLPANGSGGGDTFAIARENYATRAPHLIGSIYERGTYEGWVGSTDWSMQIGYQDGKLLTLSRAAPDETADYAPGLGLHAYWRDADTGEVLAHVDGTAEANRWLELGHRIWVPRPFGNNDPFVGKNIVWLTGGYDSNTYLGNISQFYLWNLDTNIIDYVGDARDWLAGTPGCEEGYSFEGAMAWSEELNQLVVLGEIGTSSFPPSGEAPPTGYSEELNSIHALILLDANNYVVTDTVLINGIYSNYGWTTDPIRLWYVEPGICQDSVAANVGYNTNGPVVDPINSRYMYFCRQNERDLDFIERVTASRTWSGITDTDPVDGARHIVIELYEVDLSNIHAAAHLVAILGPTDWYSSSADDPVESRNKILCYYTGDMSLSRGYLVDPPPPPPPIPSETLDANSAMIARVTTDAQLLLTPAGMIDA